MAFVYAGVVLLGFVMMFMPVFAPSSSVPGAEVASWIAGILYAGGGTAFFVPTAIALFGGRKPWVHTLGTIVVALGMTSFCCLPLLIPILINWLKPETKRWYGAR